jgi:hypothetical protein
MVGVPRWAISFSSHVRPVSLNARSTLKPARFPAFFAFCQPIRVPVRRSSALPLVSGSAFPIAPPSDPAGAAVERELRAGRIEPSFSNEFGPPFGKWPVLPFVLTFADSGGCTDVLRQP